MLLRRTRQHPAHDIIAALIDVRAGFNLGFDLFALAGAFLETVMRPSSKLYKSNVALPNALLHAIGHVCAMWAQVENCMDSALYHALARPGAPDIKTTLARPFPKRLELLEELLPLMLDKRAIEDWGTDIIAKVKAMHPRRNLIIHGAVKNSRQRRKGRNVYWFRRVRWERPAHIAEKRAMIVAQVEALAVEISGLYVMAALLDDCSQP